MRKDCTEFVARYVNTMSLSEDIIADWVIGHANPEDYPVHDVVEGKNWEYVNMVTIEDKHLSFYKAQHNVFLSECVAKGTSDSAIYNSEILLSQSLGTQFLIKKIPSLDIDIVNHNQTLTFRIHNQIDDQELGDRLYKFISVWKWKSEQYEKDGINLYHYN